MPIQCITVSEVTPFDLTFCCISCGSFICQEPGVRSALITKALDNGMRRHFCKNCEGGEWNYPFCTAWHPSVNYPLLASTWKNLCDARMFHEAMFSEISRYTCRCLPKVNEDCYYVSMTSRRPFLCNRCDKPYIPSTTHERKDTSFGYLRCIQINDLHARRADMNFPDKRPPLEIVLD